MGLTRTAVVIYTDTDHRIVWKSVPMARRDADELAGNSQKAANQEVSVLPYIGRGA